SGMRLVADLTGANLSEAKLQKTDFGQSILDRADLTRANLRGADFFEVSLRNAHLAYADLREAKTAFGMFNGADLSFADLRGADMRGYIKAANLHGAMYDQSTWWPDGFDPIAAGARRV
ncbi:MAG TPA: pentapeptide repeat-containing protein, partial [Ktedonobacteraceae bacterium]